jgi:multiple sugar transport system substrate-binding protein
MPESNPIRKEQIAAFEKTHPNIRIRTDVLPAGTANKVLIDIAAGMPPAVFFIMDTGLINYAQRGVLEPLNSYIANDPEFNLKDYYPAALRGYTYQGKLYAIPGNVTPYVMYYNKKIFDEAGLSYPSREWTWADLLAAAKKLTKKDARGRVAQFGLLINTGSLYDVLTFIKQNGGEFYNSEGTKCILDSPATRAALIFVRNLSEKYHVSPRGSDFQSRAGIDFFSMGKAAMMISGRWQTIELRRSAVAADFRITELFHGKRRATLMLGMGWAIPKAAKHKKAAWELVKFLTRQGGLNFVIDSGDGVPPLIPLANSPRFLVDPRHPNEDNEVYLESLKYAFPWPISRYIPAKEAGQLFLNEYGKFIMGRQGIGETLKKIESAINRVIQENMNKQR